MKIVFFDMGIGVSDSSSISSSNKRNFFGSHRSSGDFAQFIFGFFFWNFDKSPTTFYIEVDTVISSSFINGDDVHNTYWEFWISSDFAVDGDVAFFGFDDEFGVGSIKSHSEFVS